MNPEKSASLYYNRYFLPMASDAILYLLATCGGQFPLNKREIALRLCNDDQKEYYSRQRVYHHLRDLQGDIRNPPGKRLLCIEFGAIHPGLHIDTQPMIPPKLWPCGNNEWEVKPRQCERQAAKDGNASGWGEMVLDVDMTYDRTGICGCGNEKRVCDTCWDTFIWPAHHALDWAMKKFFGFKRVFTVFSGRRGFHMWICDPRVIRMTHLERGALVDVLSTPSPFHDDFTDGMYQILSQHFNHNVLLRDRCQNPNDHRNVVFETLWPRIDAPVARDAMQHLHKVPLVLHPSTNAICILMGPAASRDYRFRPSQDTFVVHQIGPEKTTEIVSGCAHRIIEILKEQ